MKAPVEPVATVDCPIKGCAERADVFKYAARSDDDKRKRFAGKHYAKCRVHGNLNCNEYILSSESTKWVNDPKNTPEKNDAAPVKQTEKIASSPVKSSSSKPPVTAVKSAATPVKAQPQMQQVKRWGYF